MSAHDSTQSKPDGLRAWLRHAFALDPGPAFSASDQVLLDRMVDFLVRRKLAEVAVLTLETCRPLNFLGAQALAFLRPFVRLVFKNAGDYDRFTLLLEDRATLGRLIRLIEQRSQEAEESSESEGTGAQMP